MNEAPPPRTRAAELLARMSGEPLSKLDAKLSVKDEIARSDAEIRKYISSWIIRLFVVVNVVTLGLILGLTIVDQNLLRAGLIKPDERLVNSQVLMALLGATTVQLGIIAVIMARYVFKAQVDPA